MATKLKSVDIFDTLYLQWCNMKRGVKECIKNCFAKVITFYNDLKIVHTQSLTKT